MRENFYNHGNSCFFIVIQKVIRYTRYTFPNRSVNDLEDGLQNDSVFLEKMLKREGSIMDCPRTHFDRIRNLYGWPMEIEQKLKEGNISTVSSMQGWLQGKICYDENIEILRVIKGIHLNFNVIISVKLLGNIPLKINVLDEEYGLYALILYNGTYGKNGSHYVCLVLERHTKRFTIVLNAVMTFLLLVDPLKCLRGTKIITSSLFFTRS